MANPDTIEGRAGLISGDFGAVAEPFGLFAAWFTDAKAAEPNDPDAMALATANVAAEPSVRIVLQILNALPTAFIGGVFALVLTGQSLTVASLVGFISLGGIAVQFV